MNGKNIILIEEQSHIRQIFAGMAEGISYSMVADPDPEKSAHAIQEKEAGMVIIDPYAYNGAGFSLINRLVGHETSPVVIAMSGKSIAADIVKLVKSGVFEYIAIGPDRQETENRLLGAIENAHNHILQKKHSRELRILNGYYFGRSKGGKLKDINQDSALIGSIRANFSQGMGIGAMLSIVSLMSRQSKMINDKLLVDPSLLGLLEKNARQVQKLIEAFENLEFYSGKKPELEFDPVENVLQVIHEITADISGQLPAGRKRIKISEKSFWAKQFIHWNKSYFEIVFSELIWNAVKFSPENSEIMIFLEFVNYGILISILNEPVTNIYGTAGIPGELEHLVFEPFFRLSRFVHEDTPTLDFGLGLTFVNLLMRKLNGSVMVSSLESHYPIGEKARQLVSMELWLPTYRRTPEGFKGEKSDTFPVLLDPQNRIPAKERL